MEKLTEQRKLINNKKKKEYPDNPDDLNVKKSFLPQWESNPGRSGSFQQR